MSQGGGIAPWRNAMPENDAVSSKVDISASEACTRSGVFALLLSVLCFLLIPYWGSRENEIALKKYVAYRWDLVTTAETIAETPTWRIYKVSHPGAESMSIEQLLEVKVEPSPIEARAPKAEPRLLKERRNESHPQPTKEKVQEPAAAPARPNPPKDVRVTMAPTDLRVSMLRPIDYMARIAELLSLLNDSDTLSRGRRVSRFFDVSIVRWASKRSNLMYGNAFSGLCIPKTELEILDQSKKSSYGDAYVSKLDDQLVRSCLDFQDVQDLAHFELPSLTNPTPLGSRDWTQIELSPGALPRDPYMATVVVEILMFFALIHFGAYAREAVLSPTFPAAGTLFSAFSRPPLTLLVLLFALWCPLLASLGVVATSREWPLWICTALIFHSVLSIHLVLQGKSYFSTLTLRTFTRVNPGTKKT
jgi:hypothetical protein